MLLQAPQPLVGLLLITFANVKLLHLVRGWCYCRSGRYHASRWFCRPLSAIVIGLVAGVVCAYAVGLKLKFGYDDALDVVGVHAVGGIVGALLIGILAETAVNPAGANGLLHGGGLTLLGHQAVAVGAAVALPLLLAGFCLN